MLCTGVIKACKSGSSFDTAKVGPLMDPKAFNGMEVYTIYTISAGGWELYANQNCYQYGTDLCFFWKNQFTGSVHFDTRPPSVQRSAILKSTPFRPSRYFQIVRQFDGTNYLPPWLKQNLLFRGVLKEMKIKGFVDREFYSDRDVFRIHAACSENCHCFRDSTMLDSLKFKIQRAIYIENKYSVDLILYSPGNDSQVCGISSYFDKWNDNPVRDRENSDTTTNVLFIVK
jgi:hypothetical protein